MEQRYIKLFKQILKNSETLAEQVMEFDHNKNDEKGEQTARQMRDGYAVLGDKMSAEDFHPSNLTKADYAKILVGAIIVSSHMEDRIKNEQTALQDFKIDVLPKLQRVVNECDNDLAAINLAEQLFEVKKD